MSKNLDTLVAFLDPSVNKYGYKNKHTNEIVIPPMYDKAKDFVNGFGVIKYNKKYGVINENNEKVLDNRYSKIRVIKKAFKVEEDGNIFFVNRYGAEIFNPEYTDEDIVALLKKNPENYRYIDPSSLTDEKFYDKCFSAIIDGINQPNDYYHPITKTKYSSFEDVDKILKGFHERKIIGRERLARESKAVETVK